MEMKKGKREREGEKERPEEEGTLGKKYILYPFQPKH